MKRIQLRPDRALQKESFSWLFNAPNPYGGLIPPRCVDRARFSVLFLPCGDGGRDDFKPPDRKRSHRYGDRTKHLAFPSVDEKHHWIEEGIATYVEPIARIPAGHLTAAQ